MDNDTLQALENRINDYVEAREWDEFHTPKNLAMAINAEAGELAGYLQWVNNSSVYNDELLQHRIQSEVADILIYLIRFAGKCQFDLIEAANCKINSIDERYPVDLSKGNAIKSGDL